jgi:hypothetical protein
LRRDEYGGGYFVLGFEVEELAALGAAGTARMDLVSMRMILPNWLMTMSSLVSSTSSMPATLPTLGVVFKIEFPKWESLKNKSGKSGMFFEARILTINPPASTSNPPQLHHQKTTSNHPISQNHQQKQGPTTPKKIAGGAHENFMGDSLTDQAVSARLPKAERRIAN